MSDFHNTSHILSALRLGRNPDWSPSSRSLSLHHRSTGESAVTFTPSTRFDHCSQRVNVATPTGRDFSHRRKATRSGRKKKTDGNPAEEEEEDVFDERLIEEEEDCITNTSIHPNNHRNSAAELLRVEEIEVQNQTPPAAKGFVQRTSPARRGPLSCGGAAANTSLFATPPLPGQQLQRQSVFRAIGQSQSCSSNSSSGSFSPLLAGAEDRWGAGSGAEEDEEEYDDARDGDIASNQRYPPLPLPLSGTQNSSLSSTSLLPAPPTSPANPQSCGILRSPRLATALPSLPDMDSVARDGEAAVTQQPAVSHRPSSPRCPLVRSRYWTSFRLSGSASDAGAATDDSDDEGATQEGGEATVVLLPQPLATPKRCPTAAALVTPPQARQEQPLWGLSLTPPVPRLSVSRLSSPSPAPPSARGPAAATGQQRSPSLTRAATASFSRVSRMRRGPQEADADRRSMARSLSPADHRQRHADNLRILPSTDWLLPAPLRRHFVMPCNTSRALLLSQSSHRRHSSAGARSHRSLELGVEGDGETSPPAAAVVEPGARTHEEDEEAWGFGTPGSPELLMATLRPAKAPCGGGGAPPTPTMTAAAAAVVAPTQLQRAVAVTGADTSDGDMAGWNASYTATVYDHSNYLF